MKEKQLKQTKIAIIVVLVAIMLWLNILTAIHFAQSWITEEKTNLFHYYDRFNNRTQAQTLVDQLRRATFYGTFDRIDKNISIDISIKLDNIFLYSVVWGLVQYNGSYYELHNQQDFRNIINGNATSIPEETLPHTLCYDVTGINILENNNYAIIISLLAIIDIGIFGIAYAVPKISREPPPEPTRKIK